MDVTCPVCFARYPLAAALTDAAARRALAQAVRFAGATGTSEALVLGYLECFRPPNRSLQWRRAERLLTELAHVAEAGSVRRRGRDWRIREAHWWASAILTTLERRDSGQLETPLRDHAYLYEVLAGIAHRTEGAAERRTEERRRSRPRSDQGPRSAGDVAAELPVDREAARRGIAGMAAALGRGGSDA